MIDVTILALVSMIGIIDQDGTYDTEWKLTLFEEHELDGYYQNCLPRTAGCTQMHTKNIWIYEPSLWARPMWGGGTVLYHEILHAQGLDHKQIRDCCPNPDYQVDQYVYEPYAKSPKLLHSIQFQNEMRFK